MNLKSYSRGIGAGIIVTAIIMGVASNKRTITDEEVINRAKELGYTQSSVLTQALTSDSQEVSDVSVSDTKASVSEKQDLSTSISIMSIPEEEPEEVDEPTKEDEKTVSASSSESSVSDKSSASASSEISSETSASKEDPQVIEPEEDPEEEPEEEPVDKKPLTDGDSVVITINKGDSSVTVSRRMYEAGLVESAVEFDKFLCENGYDKYLCVGDYDIIFGLDFDTMAKIITRRKLY